MVNDVSRLHNQEFIATEPTFDANDSQSAMASRVAMVQSGSGDLSFNYYDSQPDIADSELV